MKSSCAHLLCRAEDGISSLSDFRSFQYRLFFKHCGRVESSAGRPSTLCDVASNLAIYPHTSKSLGTSCALGLGLARNALHFLASLFPLFPLPLVLDLSLTFCRTRPFRNGFFFLSWLAVDNLCQREIIFCTHSHERLF